MPLFGKKQSKEGQEKTEHQLWLAREAPQSTVDLSECDLVRVPEGLFSLCKVQRKDTLRLHANRLDSLKGGGMLQDLELLKVLDLHQNELKSLPDSIGALVSLEELDLSQNKLKVVPSTLGKLSHLRILLIKSNCLKTLPGEVGQLKSLQTLNVKDNPRLTAVPPDLCRVRTLENLVVDVENMAFPPKEIVAQGLEKTMKFLCDVCEIEYVPPSSAGAKSSSEDSQGSVRSSVLDKLQQEDDVVSKSVQKLETLKEQKRKEVLAIEAQVLTDQEENVRLAARLAEQQSNLLEKVAMENRGDVEGTAQLQTAHLSQKQQLLRAVEEDDRAMSQAVKKILQERNVDLLLAEVERELVKTEIFVQQQQVELDKKRKQEILEAMKEMLADSKKEKLLSQAYENSKAFALQQVQANEDKESRRIADVLLAQDKLFHDLLSNIADEEATQVKAFQALQLEKDALYVNITNQIALHQAELARLSLEESKERRKAEQEQKEKLALIYEEQRRKTAEEMVLLMKQQERRALQLQQRLLEIENEKEEGDKDYWIAQYQKLLLSKPKLLIDAENTCDPAVKAILDDCDAGHHLVEFARHKVTMDVLKTLSLDELKKIGVYETGLRQRIKVAVEQYVADEDRAAAKVKAIEAGLEEGLDDLLPKAPQPGPSAPTLEPEKAVKPSAPPDDNEVVPSAPPLDATEESGSAIVSLPSPSPPPASAATQLATAQAECVVCLSERPNVVLLNCGHVCSCEECSAKLSICPICRSQILQKIKLYMV
ncbi:E3 ubiquitin-protein ligase LRSAM1-like isoform X2 [Oscarella lobularis]|uniref:E3 ubiquitin-protein ligase LRSAM1-like isoform X2 n=1 Tax=Oscarella lobularis TaxID=121494 RepID=UPI0033133A76